MLNSNIPTPKENNLLDFNQILTGRLKKFQTACCIIFYTAGENQRDKFYDSPLKPL